MNRETIGRYRKEAARLRIQAEGMDDIDIRRQYLDVAAQFDLLADSITRVSGWQSAAGDLAV
jgi:hypothetical protein